MIPPTLETIEQATLEFGFSMPSDRKTGALLRTLAATKPKGHLLEIGTGTGLATAWLLAGMDAQSHLDSNETDPAVLAIAQQHLEADTRVSFHACTGEDFIAQASPATYDLIFADAWPGKYALLDETLDLLKAGGLYVIDDMSPQPNWPAGHEAHVQRLLTDLENRPNLAVCHLTWATGIVICSCLA